MMNYHPQRNDITWQGTVVDYLTRYECQVQFEKTDGTVRDMKCTLQESVVPETKNTGKAKPAGVLTVFDTEKQGWRTIKFDKVINFSVQNEYIRSAN